MAASRRSMPSGRASTCTAGTFTYSALLPGSEAPSSSRLSHSCWRPVTQNSHRPQDTRGFAVTRVPTVSPPASAARGPMAAMWPDSSWPKTSGGLRRLFMPR